MVMLMGVLVEMSKLAISRWWPLLYLSLISSKLRQSVNCRKNHLLNKREGVWGVEGGGGPKTKQGVDGMMAEINHQHHQDDADQDINDNYLVNYHECTVHIHETWVLALVIICISRWLWFSDFLTEVLHVLFTSGPLRWELPPEINCFVSNNFGKAQMEESCNLANHNLRWRR